MPIDSHVNGTSTFGVGHVVKEGSCGKGKQDEDCYENCTRKNASAQCSSETVHHVRLTVAIVPSGGRMRSDKRARSSRTRALCDVG